MSNSGPEKSVLRLYVTGTTVLLIFVVVLFDFLGVANGEASGMLSAVCDARVARYLQFIAWPTFGTMCFILWLLPLLKEQVPASRSMALTSFWLMLCGIFVDIVGSVLITAPIISNAFALFGSGMMLVAAISYTVVIWRSITRTLHPSVPDTLVQCGALWLIGAISIHFAHCVGRTLDLPDALFLRSSHALIKSLGLGFVGNSGLWLLSAILPRLLQVEMPRTRVIQAMATWNGLLLVWVLGESWSTAYPDTWVRLPVAVVGAAVAGALVYLLSQTGALSYFGGKATDARRVLSRTCASSFVLSIFFVSLVIAGIGIWFGSSNVVDMPEAQALARELMRVGMGTFLLVGLGISLLGVKTADGGLGALVTWGSGIALIALAGYSGVQLTAPLTDIELSTTEPLWQILSGLGHVLIALWVVLAARD